MKTLIDYIKEEYTKSQNDEMLKHLAIAYNSKVSNINESLIFDGCEYLADFIIKRIKKHLSKNKFAITIKNSEVDLKIKFFNELEIQFIRDNQKLETSGSFIVNINTPEYNYYPKLQIIIPKIYDYNDVKGQLMHELTHIWTAYWSNLNNDNIILRLKKQGYFDFSKFDIDKNDIDLIKLINYYLINEEISAFIAQLKPELDKYKPQTPNDALKILYNSNIYKLYVGLYLSFKKNDRTLINEIIETYKKYNEEDLDNYTIERRLKNRIKRFNNKLLNSLPKLCASYFDENLLDKSYIIDNNYNKEYINSVLNRLYNDDIEIL